MRSHHGMTTPFIVLQVTRWLGSQSLTALGCVDAAHYGCLGSILELSLQGSILKLTDFQKTNYVAYWDNYWQNKLYFFKMFVNDFLFKTYVLVPVQDPIVQGQLSTGDASNGLSTMERWKPEIYYLKRENSDTDKMRWVKTHKLTAYNP